MRDFFRGWKRKFGVLTLLLACALMAGWVRSLAATDLIQGQRSNQAKYSFTSSSGSLAWRWANLNLSPGEARYPKWIVEPRNTWFYLSDDSVTWHLRGLGFGIGIRTQEDGSYSTFKVIPYWAIVVPLTLLSAWLMLSKPRLAKPPVIETAE
jgi:hypothetical protein